jgi:thiamine pyrophosphate-dependent acetolactate synthase large subunit-like protein
VNGGELIARLIREQGVEHLFTLCGGHISPILVGARRQGIRVVDVRQEPTAVFAADAVSRLTGIPGVAVVTAGPGVTNSITALKNAQMAQSPLVLFGGSPATALKGKGALQDIEQIRLMETLVKWSVTIRTDCDIGAIVSEAFSVARSGVPGPVFVECPVDLLYDEALVRDWYQKTEGGGQGVRDRVTRWYLRRHVDKLFACSARDVDTAQAGDIRPFSVDAEDVARVVSEMRTAARPVMIIGSQAALRVEKIQELSERLKESKIPVFLTGTARGLLGPDHPLQFRHGRSRALQAADLVLVAGMPCDFRLNYGRDIQAETFHIAVNRSKSDLRRNKKPDLSIQADPATFLAELAGRLQLEPEARKEWVDQLKEAEASREQQIQEFADVRTDSCNPLQFCRELDAALDAESIIVGDGGDFIATASYIIRPRGPLSWLDPGPYGTLGVGAGFALAAKLVRPEADVWLLYGDGAAGYGLMELDSFVRHGLPVIVVVGNDGGWTQIARDQLAIFQDDVATVLRQNSYHLVADALDAKGYRLETAEEAGQVLDSARTAARQGRAVLVNAYLGKTDFRKGSISM